MSLLIDVRRIHHHTYYRQLHAHRGIYVVCANEILRLCVCLCHTKWVHSRNSMCAHTLIFAHAHMCLTESYVCALLRSLLNELIHHCKHFSATMKMTAIIICRHTHILYGNKSRSLTARCLRTIQRAYITWYLLSIEVNGEKTKTTTAEKIEWMNNNRKRRKGKLKMNTVTSGILFFIIGSSMFTPSAPSPLPPKWINFTWTVCHSSPFKFKIVQSETPSIPFSYFSLIHFGRAYFRKCTNVSWVCVCARVRDSHLENNRYGDSVSTLHECLH